MLLYQLDKSYKTFVLVHPDKCQKDKEHTYGQWRGEIQANNLKKWHNLAKTLEGKKNQDSVQCQGEGFRDKDTFGNFPRLRSVLIPLHKPCVSFYWWNVYFFQNRNENPYRN